MMRHHVVLVAGLGSSLCPWRYSAWARQLKKSLIKNVKPKTGEMVIHIVSSDGSGEDAAFDQVLADRREGKLGKVLLAGHSNGAAEVLVFSRTAYLQKFPIAYCAVIDMTLGKKMWDAKAYGSIAILDEFWAGLAKADFHPSFNGRKMFHDLDEMAGTNVGHVEAASHPITQERMLKMMQRELGR